MVSFIKSSFNSFSEKIGEFGRSASAAVNSIRTKVSQAAHEVMNTGSTAIKSAYSTLADKVSENGIKVGAKVAMYAYKPQTKIFEYREKLKEMTGSNEMATSVSEMLPKLINKLEPYVTQETIKELFKTDRKLCESFAEAKLLEAIIDIVKKGEEIDINDSQPGNEKIVPILNSFLKLISASLNVPEENEENLKPENEEAFSKELEAYNSKMQGLTTEFGTLLQKVVGDKVAEKFLGKESEKNSILLAQVKNLGNELMQNLGIELGSEKSTVIENSINTVLNNFLNAGITKLLFKANEKLFSLNSKLDSSDSSKIPVDHFFTDYCKSAAENLAGPFFEECFQSNDVKPSPAIDAQKSVVTGFLEKLFNFALKWIGNELGLINDKGELFPKKKWFDTLFTPLRILKSYFPSFKSAFSEEAQDKRYKKLEELLEKIIGDAVQMTIESSVIDWIRKLFDYLAGKDKRSNESKNDTNEGVKLDK